MAGYDPKRSRPPVDVPDEGPAPVDALLEPAVDLTDTAERPASPAATTPVVGSPTPAARPAAPSPLPAPPPQDPGARLAVVAGVAAAAGVLVVLVLRRRRRN